MGLGQVRYFRNLICLYFFGKVSFWINVNGACDLLSENFLSFADVGNSDPAVGG